MKAWWRHMDGRHGDDQGPLRDALDETDTSLVRLPESFALALKSVDSGKFGGLWPRFSFLIDPGKEVALVHSYHTNRVPGSYEDFCDFVNEGSSQPRMVFQVSRLNAR